MKILQVNSVCGRGSTGRIVLDLHKKLIEGNHESYIAYGRPPAIGHQEAIRIGKNFEIYQHAALTRLLDKHGFGSKNGTRKFLKVVKTIDPDIIHLHNIHGYYINIELLFNYLKEKQKPVVWTLHDCWAFTGHCTHFEYVGCYKWKTECSSCPQKERYPTSYLIDGSKRNYEKKKQLFTGLKHMVIVTPSRWLASLVKQSFLKDYPVEVIPNGIDTSVFKPTHGDFRKKYGLENKFIILGVANVWEERKGLKHFLELASMLKEDEVIVLVGLNKKQIKKMPKGIIGIERTSSAEELAEIYTAADVFANPTLEDNYPTVSLEAQACGTYVITFDSGGSKETILKSDVTGVHLSNKTTQELRNCIDHLRGDSRISLLKQENHLALLEKQFDTSNFAKSYVELYDKILNGKVV